MVAKLYIIHVCINKRAVSHFFKVNFGVEGKSELSQDGDATLISKNNSVTTESYYCTI